MAGHGENRTVPWTQWEPRISPNLVVKRGDGALRTPLLGLPPLIVHRKDERDDGFPRFRKFGLGTKYASTKASSHEAGPG